MHIASTLEPLSNAVKRNAPRCTITHVLLEQALFRILITFPFFVQTILTRPHKDVSREVEEGNPRKVDDAYSQRFGWLSKSMYEVKQPLMFIVPGHVQLFFACFLSVFIFLIVRFAHPTTVATVKRDAASAVDYCWYLL